MRLVALALAAITAAASVASACPAMAIYDAVATPDDADVYATGGVIVTTRQGMGDAEAHDLEQALGKPSYIAAGLSVYAVPAGATEIEVNTGANATRKLAVVAAPAKLAAPKLRRVTSNATKPPSRLRPAMVIPQTETIITLAAAPPDDAFALVAYVRAGKALQPHAWFPIQKGVTRYTIATGGKPCGPRTADATFVGDVVRFAWLDRGGRVSTVSAPVRVAKRR